MRRVSNRSVPALVRLVSSVAVVQNVAPAKTPTKLGVPATREDVAKAHGVPVAILDKAENAQTIGFTQVDLARARFAPLISDAVKETANLRRIELEVEKRFEGDASKSAPVAGALKKLSETEWKSIKELVTFYEEAMYPIRKMHREYKQHELSNFHIKDVLKRGLSAFKQDFLDEQKAEKVKVEAAMKKCTDFIAAAVKDTLSTEVCNDMVNILRIAGEKNPSAHAMGVKILEDMNTVGVKYNDTTMKIMRCILFNDGPFDDSALLFEVIEYPERGEVSLNKGSLEDVSAETLKLISTRHQTPLDDGVLLHSYETHPNLQRSPE
ncbi:hypothetical protein AGDE_03415 [Angomonas deanei]|uniref:Uncharacterized protein n=1 Tax=Angomonas deanei TaxID=59799 RepID=S9VUG3_9TRYP|nr:hypothetical protein AGDE_09259 [Angomonas deanei]EPY40513.1 hypothetical protein AGDE_03415 [Angomonas deanei]CAD2212691.1 hypothetical protein, conserved [Angomonas deanei]|eukprot:EPY30801.1 hypothetical protein AGDE_09259 [Angomonas deanei]